MKKLNTLVMVVITFLFFIPRVSFAQENYLKGYVINNSGDTIHGFIDFQGWDKNPKRIAFKNTLNSRKVSYTPHNIRFFAVDGEKYQSAAVAKEISPSKLSSLNYVAEFKLQRDTVFLLTLIKGTKSLYYLKDINGKSNLYILEDGKITLLKSKKYLKNIDGENTVMFNNRYIGQLMIYLGDCPSLQKTIQQTDYGKKSLMMLFKKYYKCKRISYSYELKEGSATFELGFLGGLSLSKPVFESSTPNSQYYYLSKMEFSTSAWVTTAISFSFILPKKLNKVSLNGEILYTSFHSTGNYEYSKSDYEYGKYHTEIDMAALKFNGMMRYRIPLEKAMLFVNFGVSVSKLLGSYSITESDTYYYGVVNHDEGPAISTRSSEQSLLLGAGVYYHQFSFEARYEYSNGFNDVVNLKMNINRYYFMVGYHLKHKQ